MSANSVRMAVRSEHADPDEGCARTVAQARPRSCRRTSAARTPDGEQRRERAGAIGTVIGVVADDLGGRCVVRRAEHRGGCSGPRPRRRTRSRPRRPIGRCRAGPLGLRRHRRRRPGRRLVDLNHRGCRHDALLFATVLIDVQLTGTVFKSLEPMSSRRSRKMANRRARQAAETRHGDPRGGAGRCSRSVATRRRASRRSRRRRTCRCRPSTTASARRPTSCCSSTTTSTPKPASARSPRDPDRDRPADASSRSRCGSPRLREVRRHRAAGASGSAADPVLRQASTVGFQRIDDGAAACRRPRRARPLRRLTVDAAASTVLTDPWFAVRLVDEYAHRAGRGLGRRRVGRSADRTRDLVDDARRP